MRLIKGLKNAGKNKAAPAQAPEAVKAGAKAVSNGSSLKSRGKPVTIEANIDVGYGNSLYLRGEGLGLNWNQGIPLKCEDGSTWKWT